MTPWRDRLSTLAHERLPAEVAAKWIELVRPGIRLVSAGAGPRVGWLGGAPVMPAGLEWPEWPGRGPLDFLAAVDCAALPRESLSVPLPEAGTLLFFYFDGFRREADDDWPLLEDVEGAQVVFVPAGVPVVERKAPEGLDPYPARDLYGEVVATAPGREHILLDQTEISSGDSLAEAAVAADRPPDFLGAGVFDDLVWKLHEKGPHHQVGGFAAPIQGAVENEIAAEVVGDYRDPLRVEEAARWVLLAQIDSDDEADMIWGDAGMLYWMIRAEDLEAGRFDRVRCTLQCG